PVRRFMLPIVAIHDRARFEVVCYSDFRSHDAVTAAIRERADRFIASAALDHAQFAAQVRADGIDVLVDLALHSGRNRLLAFARRAAPVQVTYLGYPGTSGLAAMDFRLTDPQLDPLGSDVNYSETSLRLPRTYWCYVLPPNMPGVGPLPAASAGHITFGCLNKFTKVSDDALRAWAQVLARTPNSRLILHAPVGQTRDRVLAMMGTESVAPERIEFVVRRPAVEYLETYNRIDVALDPFPYNGGTTTCEALLMGAPVVSLAGDIAVRRAGVSILTNVGLTELIARTPAEYVEIATELAADRPRLSKIRGELRGRMLASPLSDLPAFARDLEAAYLSMWNDVAQARAEH
ncbi:MAG: protein O-GlcNAc transferase, partial [Humisphaera sp.]|nr:protein O-GlcNAc transferase [Humisphaera sp.]